MDGGFVIKKLKARNKKFPAVGDILGECERIKCHQAVAGLTLLRVYFYDAKPATGVLRNPIDGSVVDLTATPVHSQCTSLHQALEMQPDIALRMGDSAVHGWTIGQQAMKSLSKKPRAPTARDLVPNIEQKGVDLRVGLDISRLSLTGKVDVVVVVTGDSDFIPAFKFARREGVPRVPRPHGARCKKRLEGSHGQDFVAHREQTGPLAAWRRGVRRRAGDRRLEAPHCATATGEKAASSFTENLLKWFPGRSADAAPRQLAREACLPP